MILVNVLDEKPKTKKIKTFFRIVERNAVQHFPVSSDKISPERFLLCSVGSETALYSEVRQ